MKWFRGLSSSAKAVVAFFGPTVTEALAALEVSVQTHHVVHWALVGIGAAVNLWAAILVWAVPNKPLDATQPIPIVQAAP